VRPGARALGTPACTQIPPCRMPIKPARIAHEPRRRAHVCVSRRVTSLGPRALMIRYTPSERKRHSYRIIF